MTDLVPADMGNSNRSLAKAGAATIFDMSPQDMIKHATGIANVLKDVIVQQGLAVRIGGSDHPHVKAEGWATLGVLLGILPREKDVRRLDDGSFEAYVDLVSQRTGMVVGGASSLCSKSESRWGRADEFARRSMAITRATSKAYRLSFGWIMTLAGYSPTPADEMPDDPRLEQKQAPDKPRREEKTRETKRQESPKQADQETYDPSKPGHTDRLASAMEKVGVPFDKLDRVAKLMEGKPMVPASIKQALADAELPF